MPTDAPAIDRIPIDDSNAEEAMRLAGWFVSKNKAYAMRATNGTSADAAQECLTAIIAQGGYPQTITLSTAIGNHFRWSTYRMLQRRDRDPASSNPLPISRAGHVPSPYEYQDDRILDYPEIVSHMLRTLTYREREIIKLRYGLSDGTQYTLEQCGRIFKITRERVRNIESKAIAKLQHQSRHEKIPFACQLYRCRQCQSHSLDGFQCESCGGTKLVPEELIAEMQAKKMFPDDYVEQFKRLDLYD